MRRLLVGLLVLLAIAVGADRLAVHLADTAVARDIQSGEHLNQRPTVRIGGVPFLTQVIAGHYDSVDVTIRDLRRGPWRIDRVSAHLSGVLLPLAVIVGRGRKHIVIQQATGDVWLTYADLDAGLAPRGLRIDPGGSGTVIVRGTVAVAGASVQLSGRGRVTVSGDTVLVTVDRTLGGVPVTALQLDFAVPLPRLPFGFQLTGVTATDVGIDVAGRAGPVVVTG